MFSLYPRKEPFMSEISIQTGAKIRACRKKRHLTLEQLSAIIAKSRSTLSKYETGEISIDLETLYEIADALHVRTDEFLYIPEQPAAPSGNGVLPAFFRDISRFYSYIYDGRVGKIIRCVFELGPALDNNRQRISMYMNFKDYKDFQNAENTYYGWIEHFDALTNIQLVNRDMPMEKASVQILAATLDSDTKRGLFNGFSSRPMMPIAAKMLLSRTRLTEDKELLHSLKISREDIRLMKLYNMMSVT